jgi:hypothetical protein
MSSLCVDAANTPRLPFKRGDKPTASSMCKYTNKRPSTKSRPKSPLALDENYPGAAERNIYA